MKRIQFALMILVAAILLGAKALMADEPAASPAVAAGANNAFAFDLYARLATADGGNDNLFFSPYSISSALTMTRLGARGATANEMAATLRLPADIPALESSYAALNQSLVGDPQQQAFTLSVANALWGQKGEDFLPDYLDAVKKDFGANLASVDYFSRPEIARGQINDWVAHQTHDKIKDLLPKDSVTSEDRLILTNAIYFKGQWMAEFDAKKTTKADFLTQSGKSVKSDMMQAYRSVMYGADDLCQVVKLPYKGEQLSMIVLLPKAAPSGKSGLERLEAALTPAYLDKLTSGLDASDVVLLLPKWEATQPIMLTDTLEAMGMKQAFTPAADFSGINGRKDLFVSGVFHKAYIKVDEQGTEAAAATAVAVAQDMDEPRPLVFAANHPFIYLIVDDTSHAILFAGRLCDPSAGK